MRKSAQVMYALMAAMVFVAVIVGGYLLGWWLQEDAVNREGEIRRNQFEVQETARDEVLRQDGLIADIDVQIADPEITDQQRSALRGQREAAVTQLCNVASDITGSVTPAVSVVIAEHC